VLEIHRVFPKDEKWNVSRASNGDGEYTSLICRHKPCCDCLGEQLVGRVAELEGFGTSSNDVRAIEEIELDLVVKYGNTKFR